MVIKKKGGFCTMLQQEINLEALGIFGSNTTTDVVDAVVIPEPTLAERVARLEARGIDDGTLLEMFQLSLAELRELRVGDEYGAALSQGQQHQVERPLQIDDSWDDVESTALNKLRGTVANEYDSDRLLKIASVANRAARRSEKAKSGELDATKSETNIVQVNFSPTFIQQLQTINPQQEHARVAKLAGGKKMIDYLPQNEFEKVVASEVNNNMKDELADAVALLDNMVLGA